MLPVSQNASPNYKTPKCIAVLGSTGSIGCQTLDIVAASPEKLKVEALVAGSNASLLIQQAIKFKPALVGIADVSKLATVKEALRNLDCIVVGGEDALELAVEQEKVEVIVAAVVGFAGLKSVVRAIELRKEVALANKETLVVAGEYIQRLAREQGVYILPIDSEHSAIFQCVVGEPLKEVEKIILTASGGPFRSLPKEKFSTITREQALNHPNWTMGAKITIDSATMMNKGLEVIEAKWLFDLEPNQIEVLVHPQSIIHSMVQFTDGSTKAQLGVPDMKVPIQYALSFPERWKAEHERLDWSQIAGLSFEPPDFDKFPCLGFAFEALCKGGTAPLVLNAANEIAVERFLNQDIKFIQIPTFIEKALFKFEHQSAQSVEAMVSLDREVRSFLSE